jgi:hypothetical protein
MKAKRNLSGIYFRSQTESGKWENRVFEDLNEEYQDEILKDRDTKYLKSMVKILANTINSIGDQLDLIAE